MQKKEIKNILFVTDLSPETLPVAREAAAVAKKLGARLILLHTFSPEIQEESELIFEENKEQENANLEEAQTPAPEHELQKKLDELANKLHLDFEISVTRILKPNLLEKEITNLAEQLNARLQRAKTEVLKPEIDSPEALAFVQNPVRA